MKLLLLKTLLQRRARDEGFTLPMVIALGLVMILLGTINIVKSSEENINSIAQSQRTDAFAVAELGAAQYRQFFDRNRSLLIQNRDQWTSQTDVCETILDTANGWASNEPAGTAFNAANWRNMTLNEVELGTDLNDDGDATDTDPAIDLGSYKIVDYEYDNDNTLGDSDDNGIFNLLSDANPDDDPLTLAPGVTAGSITAENDIDDDGQSDAKGILTIKARTPGTDGSEIQIEYEIPIRVNENDLDNLDPALWVNQSNITDSNLGNLTINGGNLLVSHRIADGNVTWDGAASATAPCQDPDDITIGTNTILVESDPRGVPDITRMTNFYSSSTLPVASQNSYTSGVRLGRRSDNEFDDGNPNNDPLFYYTAVAPLAVNSDIQTDGIANVILYVNGDITINVPDGDVRNVGFEPTLLDYTSPNLQIHSTGNITINTNSGGTVNITGLIHAPNGTLDIDGNGTVNIVGSLWVNEFDNSDNATVNITTDQINTATGFEDSYTYYVVANDRDPKPISQPPTNWKTEEVN